MVELDFPTISTIISLAAVGMGTAFALGTFYEKVKNLEKRVDKLESSKNNDKQN